MQTDTLTVVALILGVAMVVVAMSMVVVSVLAYMIAKLYAPEQDKRRPVPRLGKAMTMLAGGAAIDREDLVKGVNGYPDQPDEDTPQVAERAVVTEVTGAAEGTLATERERWWEEKRADGYDDEEIAEMETGNVVHVFEDA